MRSRRWVLMNPGPVNVTEKVRRALRGPDICHREEEFSELLRRVRQALLRIFHIENSHTVVLLTGSGTLAVEAMLSSFGAKDKKILVLSNGVYGDRLASILAAHRLPHRVLRKPLGTFPSVPEVESALRSDPAIRAIAMVHHETSTGMLNPLDEVGQVAKKFRLPLLLDAVSSLGAETVDFSKNNVALCAGSSGKCLHAYPGVSFVFIAKNEVAGLKRALAGSVYLDLDSALEAEDKNSPPFTPAVPLFYALAAALDELEKEGLNERIRKYALKNSVLENGLARLGIRFLVEKKYRSHVLTAFKLPPGIRYPALHDRLKQKGFIIYEGQSSLKHEIFRVANLGDLRITDLERFVRCVEKITGRRKPPVVILLAAGVGRRFGPKTRSTPKCLIALDRSGQTLLSRYFDAFRETGLEEIAIVVGHRKEKIKTACRKFGKGLKIRFIENREYTKGSVLSLYRASGELRREVVIMDADVFFPVEALGRLLDAPKKSAFLIDPRARSTGEEMIVSADRRGRPVSISKTPDRRLRALGEATGIVQLSENDAKSLRRILKDFYRKKNVRVEYEESYTELMRRTQLGTVSIGDLFWTEMDFPEDLARIQKTLHP